MHKWHYFFFLSCFVPTSDEWLSNSKTSSLIMTLGLVWEGGRVLRTLVIAGCSRRVCGGGGSEEEESGSGCGNRTSISLPKTLSCISGSCLEACERAKRLELRGRLTAAQRTLRHLTIGTATQTTRTHTNTHVHRLRNTSRRTHRLPLVLDCLTCVRETKLTEISQNWYDDKWALNIVLIKV